MNSNEFIVRDGTEGDLKQVAYFVGKLAEYHGDVSTATEESLRRVFFSKPEFGWLLVAELDGIVVGYAALNQRIRLQAGTIGCDMHHLFVDKAHRRNGVGKRLVEACLEKTSSLGGSFVVVGTHPENMDAQKTYLAMGFKSRGSSPPTFTISV